jgi:outer membrane immunogenic protein
MRQLNIYVAILLGNCSVLLAGTSALADGLYTRSTSYPPPLSWSGFYIGAIAGAAWSKSDASSAVTYPGSAYFNGSDISQIDSAGAQKRSDTGFTGGFETGINFQTGSWVFGAEADFSSLRVRDQKSTTVEYNSVPGTFFTVNSDTSANWLITLRPRLGYAINNLLFYGTGGLALSNVRHNFSFSDTFASAAESASASTTVGWTAGGGIELMICRNWTMKAEYLFVDFGEENASGTIVVQNPSSSPTLAHQADLTAQIGRAGINYKF